MFNEQFQHRMAKQIQMETLKHGDNLVKIMHSYLFGNFTHVYCSGLVHYGMIK